MKDEIIGPLIWIVLSNTSYFISQYLLNMGIILEG